ncbi:toll/interleukin-1 receptor domain-containing protein [Rhodopirellula bahusiensis]|nr:toll/interleukin-1 receptor domain-containing protein [Rhodopirellula bahusiensis]
MAKASRKIKASTKEVFVSHAAADELLVDAFVDLLETGLGLRADRIFCSSLDGMGIPSGKNFKDYIRTEIESPKVVILMLSPNYFASQFCLCELGAAWILAHAVIPILIPPSDFHDMKAVLSGVQGRRIAENSDLSEIRDELVVTLGLEQKTARWEAKKRQFIEKLPMLLDELPNPKMVDSARYEELQSQYEDGVNELTQAYDQLDDLKRQLEAVKKLKDAEEVAEFEIEESDDWDTFAILCQEAKSCLNKLPLIVREVAYHELTNREYRVPDSWGDRTSGDSVREAEQEDFLEIDSNGEILLNREDPTVSFCISAVNKAAEFAEGQIGSHEVDDRFFEQYAEKYGHQLKFASKRFWETQFDL